MNLGAWLSGRDAVDTSVRAERAWARIQDRPAVITLVRDGAARAAQTVRIEPYRQRGIQEATGGAGMSARQSLSIFGIRDHATETDTDIARDDRFVYQDKFYRVVHVNLFPGEVQALAEAQS